MQNIYGESVKLTPAQTRAYIALLGGPISVERAAREFRTYKALVNKGLVRIAWAYPNSCKFERWM